MRGRAEAGLQPHAVFFETTREAMYVSSRAGHFLDANPAFCHLLDYPRQDLVGSPVTAVLALPGERRRFLQDLETHRSVTGFRVLLLSRGGEELPSQISAVVLPGDDGTTEGYVGLVRPQRLQPELEPFTLALRGSQDGLWEWNLKRGIVEYSARWKALLGYASFELGRSVNEWFDRVHREDLTAVKQAIQTYMKGGAAVLSAYFRMQNKAGDYQWMLVRGVGDFDDHGRCLKLAGSLSNITSHIRMVESLKQQEEQLEQVNEELSHDKALLARFFSGDVLARILQEGGAGAREALGPATLLQVKVNDLDRLWERAGPAEFATFLNDLLTDLMDLVYARGGSVNKILGDTLLISFGAPLPQPEDGLQALTLAYEILEYRSTFNAGRPDWLDHDLTFSLGLASGEVFSGTFGSVHRVEYTLLGEPVSRAGLLQRSAEKLGLEILVDESARLSAGSPDTLVPAVAPERTDGRPLPSLAGLWTLGVKPGAG